MEDTNLTPPADAAAPDAQVTANTDADAAAPEPEAGPLAGIEQAIEHAVEVVEADVMTVVHTIERRTFGRASADEPMPTTTITGN